MADERLSRARFIRLGAALGVGAAGASVIAACGGGGESAGNGGGGSGGGGAATTEAEQPPAETTPAPAETTPEQGGGGGGGLASEADVPPGTAVTFEEAGQPAVLVHLENGDFAAYSAVCTHAQCTVAYQEQTAQLACPCHGSVFDPADGAAVVNGPAQTPLPEIPVEVREGQVFRA